MKMSCGITLYDFKAGEFTPEHEAAFRATMRARLQAQVRGLDASMVGDDYVVTHHAGRLNASTVDVTLCTVPAHLHDSVWLVFYGALHCSPSDFLHELHTAFARCGALVPENFRAEVPSLTSSPHPEAVAAHHPAAAHLGSEGVGVSAAPQHAASAAGAASFVARSPVPALGGGAADSGAQGAAHAILGQTSSAERGFGRGRGAVLPAWCTSPVAARAGPGTGLDRRAGVGAAREGAQIPANRSTATTLASGAPLNARRGSPQGPREAASGAGIQRNHEGNRRRRRRQNPRGGSKGKGRL
jgi:hypothetical protein